MLHHQLPLRAAQPASRLPLHLHPNPSIGRCEPYANQGSEYPPMGAWSTPTAANGKRPAAWAWIYIRSRLRALLSLQLRASGRADRAQCGGEGQGSALGFGLRRVYFNSVCIAAGGSLGAVGGGTSRAGCRSAAPPGLSALQPGHVVALAGGSRGGPSGRVVPRGLRVVTLLCPLPRPWDRRGASPPGRQPPGSAPAPRAPRPPRHVRPREIRRQSAS